MRVSVRTYRTLLAVRVVCGLQAAERDWPTKTWSEDLTTVNLSPHPGVCTELKVKSRYVMYLQETNSVSCCSTGEQTGRVGPHLGSQHGAVQLAGALLVPQLELQRSQSSWGDERRRQRAETQLSEVIKNQDLHQRTEKITLLKMCQDKLKACERTERDLSSSKSNLVEQHLSCESEHNTSHVNTENPLNTHTHTHTVKQHVHASVTQQTNRSWCCSSVVI